MWNDKPFHWEPKRPAPRPRQIPTASAPGRATAARKKKGRETESVPRKPKEKEGKRELREEIPPAQRHPHRDWKAKRGKRRQRQGNRRKEAGTKGIHRRKQSVFSREPSFLAMKKYFRFYSTRTDGILQKRYR